MDEELEHIPIIMQGLPKWDSPYEATSFHIAKGLSKSRKVFYVEHPFTWKDFLTKFKSDQIRRRIRNKTGQPFKNFPNLTYIYAPFISPFNFLPEGTLFKILCRLVNRRIWLRVKSVISKHNITKFIYINSFDPVFNFARHNCEPLLSIYLCFDWMDSNPYIARHGVRQERRIMKESDFVVCTSKSLQNYAKTYNDHCFFIGNAVNIYHFLSNGAHQPKEYAQIERPIVLFLGNIDNRLDFDLIIATVEANPSLQFVFVGPIQKSAKSITTLSHKNIHFLGPKEYKEVPSYMKNSDVCWIPFRKNNQTKHIYPLKLHEYLACGKPVVTTKFTDLEEFKDVVHITDQNTAIKNSVFSMLMKNDEHKRNKRINVAKNNTWANRIEEWNSLIKEFLVKKVESDRT